MSDWTYDGLFLTVEEADVLYRQMMTQPWTIRDEDSYAIHYGCSYAMGGGPRAGEIPAIPSFLSMLADRVSAITEHAVNYVQCHRLGHAVPVLPHEDPRGMCVPMVVVGQQRTFRVGGSMYAQRTVKQSQRQVAWHEPEQEILLQHGSLLVFNGGRTLHSMYPAAQDDAMGSLGFDWRISLLFRFTTPSMRAYGPGARVLPAEYIQAREEFRSSKQPSLFAGKL
jgi:hypothetical protein